ncbi:unnamed protein product [Amoebophrya sp. A120]|nr:unnamed protein product [Amoebophrya sp. A120]|eukprot:GSA120T00001900001.1
MPGAGVAAALAAFIGANPSGDHQPVLLPSRTNYAFLSPRGPFATSDNGAGACLGTQDHTIWEDVKTDMNDFMKTCILQGPPGCDYRGHCINAFGHPDKPNEGAECMAHCISVREGFDAPCADCFGKLSRCTFENCAMSCLDPEAAMCKSCILKFKCEESFKACSGLTDLPGAKQPGAAREAIEMPASSSSTPAAEMEPRENSTPSSIVM